MLNPEYVKLKAERISAIQTVMLTGIKSNEIDVIDYKIQLLRDKCKHSYEKGMCIYCEMEAK